MMVVTNKRSIKQDTIAKISQVWLVPIFAIWAPAGTGKTKAGISELLAQPVPSSIEVNV